jgi:hypothetical protein
MLGREILPKKAELTLKMYCDILFGILKRNGKWFVEHLTLLRASNGTKRNIWSRGVDSQAS